MGNKVMSVGDINTRAAAGRGFEMELEYPRGKPLGVFLTILGEHSEAVETFEVERADQKAEASYEAMKKGDAKARSTKQALAEGLESAVFRVTGWRGLKESFSKELLRTFLTNNPDFVDQVIAASRDRANFTLA